MNGNLTGDAFTFVQYNLEIFNIVCIMINIRRINLRCIFKGGGVLGRFVQQVDGGDAATESHAGGARAAASHATAD